MTDIKCLEYDDEAAIIFIQKKLPKELNISDDDIQYVLDVIYDFYAYLGHRVVRCRYCGRMIRLKKHERASKQYCPSCAKIRNHDRVKKHRLKQKTDQN